MSQILFQGLLLYDFGKDHNIGVVVANETYKKEHSFISFSLMTDLHQVIHIVCSFSSLRLDGIFPSRNFSFKTWGNVLKFRARGRNLNFVYR